jgi:hypothetical protein
LGGVVGAVCGLIGASVNDIAGRVNASNLAGQGRAVVLSSNDIIGRRIRYGRKGFEVHRTIFW